MKRGDYVRRVLVFALVANLAGFVLDEAFLLGVRLVERHQPDIAVVSDPAYWTPVRTGGHWLSLEREWKAMEQQAAHRAYLQWLDLLIYAVFLVVSYRMFGKVRFGVLLGMNLVSTVVVVARLLFLPSIVLSIPIEALHQLYFASVNTVLDFVALSCLIWPVVRMVRSIHIVREAFQLSSNRNRKLSAVRALIVFMRGRDAGLDQCFDIRELFERPGGWDQIAARNEFWFAVNALPKLPLQAAYELLGRLRSRRMAGRWW